MGKKRGLGPWDSYGVGMKMAPPQPQPWINYAPARPPEEQALLDLAREKVSLPIRNDEPPLRTWEEIDAVARRQARAATWKAGLILGSLYLGAFIIWGIM